MENPNFSFNSAGIENILQIYGRAGLGMGWKKGCVFAFMALFTAAGLMSGGYARRGFAAGPAVQASGANLVQSNELIHLVNGSRIAQGLPPLVTDTKLMRFAQEHAEEMAKQGFVSHDMPSGGVFVRMKRDGYKHGTARENVAKARMISSAHSGLLKSPSHKANILATDVTHIGIGIAKGDPAFGEYLFIAEVFASPRND